MQKFKKFIAVFVTMVMVMATGVVGFGAGAEKATVTVNLTEAAGTSGIDVTAYKLMSLNKEENYTFTVNPNNKTALQNALGLSDKASDQEIINEVKKAMPNESQKIKRLAENLSEAQLNDGTTINIGNGLTQGKFEQNTEDKRLELGYYLISANNNNKIQRALVVVDGDREVTLKAEELIFTKDSDSYTHEIGETIYYTITTEIPKETDEAFALKDTLSKGLEYVTEKTAEGKNMLKLNIVVEGKGSQEVKVEVKKTLDTQLDSFELPLKDYIDGNGGKKLTIKYEARAKKESEKKESNTAILTYKDGNLEDSEDTFTYPIYISKIDKNDKTFLAGAKFELHEKDGNTNRAIKLVGQNGEYTVDKARDSNSPATQAETIITPFGSGNTKYNLKINGLRADKEYLLIETEAPKGYNKLEKPLTIKIEPITNDKESWRTMVDGAVVNDNIIVVPNGKGGLLPETGGMGTIIFTIVGLGLILAALGMRKTKKEQ